MAKLKSKPTQNNRNRSVAAKRRSREWNLPDLPTVAVLSDLVQVDSETLWWLASPQAYGSRTETDAHYHRWWIRKRSSGWRLVEAPKATLKFVQRRLLEELLQRVPVHPLSFGFVKGKSVIDFTKPHWRRDCCLKLDLRDFFVSVSAARVFGLFLSFGYNVQIARLLTLLTTAATPNSVLDNHVRGDARRKLTIRHLPQGSPTSPALANLCAYRMDARLSGLARSIGGVHYSRYADDLLFSGNQGFARKAQSLPITIGAIAIEEGFELNFRKTRVMRSSQRQLAAGMVLNDGANLSRNQYEELKATLHNCIRFGPSTQNHSSEADFRMHLEGRVAWAKRVRSGRGEKLQRMLEQIDWSM